MPIPYFQFLNPDARRRMAKGSWIIAPVLLVLVVTTTWDDGLKPHEVYESKCGECHAAHAGDFLVEELETAGGVLVGLRSGRPVEDKLNAGHGELTEKEIINLTEMFSSMQKFGGVFRKKCQFCHDRASELARLKLTERDGVLYERYTGTEISSFLRNHGRLEPHQVPVMVEMLEQQLIWTAGQ